MGGTSFIQNDVLRLERQADGPVQIGQREVIVRDGPELVRPGRGEVPLVLQDRVARRKPGRELLLFGAELLLLERPSGPVGDGALVVRLDRTQCGLDFEDGLLLEALEPERGLVGFESRPGVSGARQDGVEGNGEAQGNRPVPVAQMQRVLEGGAPPGIWPTMIFVRGLSSW
jgi:hypothetical protein